MNNDINDINDASMALAGVGLTATVASGVAAGTGIGLIVAPEVEAVALVSDGLSGVLGVVADSMELAEAIRSGNKKEEIEASVGIAMNAVQMILPMLPGVMRFGEKYALKYAEMSADDIPWASRIYRGLAQEEGKYGFTTLRRELSLLRDDAPTVAKTLRKLKQLNAERRVFYKNASIALKRAMKESPQIRKFVSHVAYHEGGSFIKNAIKSFGRNMFRPKDMSEADKLLGRTRLIHLKIAARVTRSINDTHTIVHGVSNHEKIPPTPRR